MIFFGNMPVMVELKKVMTTLRLTIIIEVSHLMTFSLPNWIPLANMNTVETIMHV